MKCIAQIACILGLIFASVPAAMPAAQLGSQPFVFYGEEPWGGSYLGVDTEDVTSERIGALHLKEERGVEVTMVDQDAPAGKVGIKEHDVILSINDQQVQSCEQLRRLIREIPVGRTVSIGLSRDGEPLTLKAQLAERSKMPNVNPNISPAMNLPLVRIPPINIPEIDVPNIVVVHAPRSSGMMIENLTPQLGEFFGAKGGNGVLVRSVEKGSRAEQAGLHAGDVVVKINGSAVNDCSDFTRLIRSRTANKATIVVLRDKHEQTLTMSLPEPRRTGSLQGQQCESDEVACAEFSGNGTKIAALAPRLEQLKRLQPELDKMKKQIEEEVKKQKPAMEKLHKEVQQQVESQRGAWQKQIEDLQKELKNKEEEMQKQFSEFHKHDAEI